MSAMLPTKTITLKPELSLIASLAHESPYQDLLPSELYEPESVASSIKIGEGITFTVTKKKVVKPFSLLPQKVERSKVSVTASTNHLDRRLPPYIVYKIPDIRFGPDGHAIEGGGNERNLASVLLEFFVLLHSPVRQHPFLPTLWGFAWGQNRYTVHQRIPISIVDYADFGSLVDHQKKHSLTEDVKRQICWQIGTALAFLHGCGICHGDVKSENVLLYPSHTNQTEFVAKLTDFGLSHISFQGSFNFLPPGTCLWAAPEVLSGGNVLALHKADTFSFGLLVWRTFCDGLDPLSTLFMDSGTVLPRTKEEAIQISEKSIRLEEGQLQARFQGDQIVKIAASMSWRIQIMVQNLFLSPYPDRSIPLINTVQKLLSQYQQGISPEAISKTYQSNMEWLVILFEKTLPNSPEARDLSLAIEALETGTNYVRPLTKVKTLSYNTDRRFQAAATNGHPISWIAMRRLQPQVCDFIFGHRLARAEKDDAANTIFTGLHLGNAACLISGMGSSKHRNIKAGLEAISLAARRDNREAGGIVFRFYNAFNQDPPDDIDYKTKMWDAAIYGSVAAFEDLKLVAGELAQSVRSSMLRQTCGVGANFFWDLNCLNGWKFSDRTNFDWINEVLRESKDPPDSIIVNRRGDNFLHAAASLLIEDLVPILLSQYHFNINKQNDEGETPLLCALRSGAFGIAHELLDRGADPTIISKRCESPFHWLISISEVGQKAMMDKLIAKGGWMTITCWAEICDYAAVQIPSFHHYAERLSKGTPLHWAICRKKPFLIRLLLEQGAPARFYGPERIFYTAYEQAAYLHEAALLRLLIEKTAPHPRHPAFATRDRSLIYSVDKDSKLPEGVTTLGGLPEMVKAAIDGSDRYSSIIRHGDRHLSQMRRIFKLLGEEMEHVTFTLGLDEAGHTPLYYAAMNGFGDATEHIFQFMKGEKDVNVPYGTLGWTPICEAIRRNHIGIFHSLVQHGAHLNINVDNPAGTGKMDWGLLHLAAQSVVGEDLAIAQELIQHGVAVDEYGTKDDPSESPLCVAVQCNQFELASLLRISGARINALSTFISRPRMKLKVATTVLGRIIAANMRYSSLKLRYLLYPKGEVAALEQPAFIVEQKTGYTALHWSLLVEELIEDPEERDECTRDEIFALLVEKFDSEEELNCKTKDKGRTALHIAAANGHLVAVERLLECEADSRVEDLEGKTALELAVDRLEGLEQQRRAQKEVDNARAIVSRITDSLAEDA